MPPPSVTQHFALASKMLLSKVNATHQGQEQFSLPRSPAHVHSICQRKFEAAHYLWVNHVVRKLMTPFEVVGSAPY